MGSSESFVGYVLERLAAVENVWTRKMFGEFAVYADTKVVGLVCDNQLFVKPTPAGRAFIGEPEEQIPYPGGKPWFLVQERLDDDAWLAELVRITAAALPEPAPKKPRARRTTAKRRAPSPRDR